MEKNAKKKRMNTDVDITVVRSEIEGTADLEVAKFAANQCSKVGLESPSDSSSTKSPETHVPSVDAELEILSPR